MSIIFENLNKKIAIWRQEAKVLVEKSGNKILSEVTVAQAYGGMRGVRSLICDTSRVPQDEGLIIRGTHLIKLVDKTPEEIFYLLLTGDLPTREELKDLSEDIKKRKRVPSYVWDILKAMPKDSHPMAMLDTAILAMQKESVFFNQYESGLKKEDYWKATLEDALNIVAKIPAIAAAVYRLRFNKGDRIASDPDMDITGD